MTELSDIDSIIQEVLKGGVIPSESELPSREAQLARLPSIPRIVPPEPPSPPIVEEVPKMISVMYENGSISYINLETVPVIQRTIDDTYFLMWPDTANGVLLKALYIFQRTTDPVAYQRIERYLASKLR